MAWCLLGKKPLLDSILTLLTTAPSETKFQSKHTFSVKKMHLNMSEEWRPFCSGLNMLNPPSPLNMHVNSSPPGQNGCHFADNIFQCIFMNEKFWILIQISLKFVLKGQIDNEAALVKAMAWRRTGDKPLPEPMLIQFTDLYMGH